MVCAVLAMQEFAVYEPTGISVVATEVRMVFETGAFSSPDNPITAPMGGGGGVGARRRPRRPARPRRRGGGDVAAAAGRHRAARDPGLSALRANSRADRRDRRRPLARALDAGAVVTIAAVLVVIVAVDRAGRVARRARWKFTVSPVDICDEFAPQISGSLLIGRSTGIVAIALAIGSRRAARFPGRWRSRWSHSWSAGN